MKPTAPVPDLISPDLTPLETAGETHKFSRKTVLKDREASLRANLLKRKQQKHNKVNEVNE